MSSLGGGTLRPLNNFQEERVKHIKISCYFLQEKEPCVKGIILYILKSSSSGEKKTTWY